MKDTKTLTNTKQQLGVKFYLLYSDNKQTKLLTSATSKESLELESQYYADGVWFEYDTVVGSNLIVNEKQVKGVTFPTEPKSRHPFEQDKTKNNFKWVA